MIELVQRVYVALRAGDREALLAVMAPEFEASVSEGMPLGVGGPHHGAEAMVDDVWWVIGRRYSVFPEPEDWISCGDDRLLVLGTYRGRERATGFVVEAAFDHLWTARGDRLVALRQLADTARWTA